MSSAYTKTSLGLKMEKFLQTTCTSVLLVVCCDQFDRDAWFKTAERDLVDLLTQHFSGDSHTAHFAKVQR